MKLLTCVTAIFLLLSCSLPCLAQSTTTNINLTACYSSSAKKGASSFDGRVAVGVLCKQKTDLLINDQFSASDPSGARPVLERKRLVINNKIPNGIEYGMIASSGVKKFYEVQVTAVCCPVVSSSAK